MNKRSLALAFILLLCVAACAFAWQKRQGLSHYWNLFSYRHLGSGGAVLDYQELFAIKPAEENPLAGHQGVTSDGDFIYVVYPEDDPKGNGKGVVQQYSLDGRLLRSWCPVPVGHASNSCVLGSRIYILPGKALSDRQRLIVLDTSDGSVDSLTLQFPVAAVWEGICSYGDSILMAGLNGSGHTFFDARSSSRHTPDTLSLAYISDGKVVRLLRRPFSFGKPHFTVQGVCAAGSELYLLSSSYIPDSLAPRGYRHGMDCIVTRFSLPDMCVATSTPPAAIVPKPEGAFFNPRLSSSRIFTSTGDSLLFSIPRF